MPNSKHPRYAELHAHSAFSFLDGASQPEELAAAAVRQGVSALAITDHDGLYGVVRFAEASRELGLPTVFGAELSLHQEGPTTGVADPDSTHLLVLTRGAQGYRRLSQAIAEAHLATGEKGRASYHLEELGALADGEWLVLTGCRKSAVPRALNIPGAQGFSQARAELDRLTAIFGRDNVAVELTDNAGPLDSVRCDLLAWLAEDAGLPVVATGNVHYATPAEYPLATVLSSVRSRLPLTELDGWLPPAPSSYIRSPSEMAARFSRFPTAVPMAATFGDECAFDLKLVAPNLPPYEVPQGYVEASWLRELTWRGAKDRYGPRAAERVPGAYTQLDHELATIEELGFPGYFLIVHDIVDFCRREDILCQGRGSAANSAVCFALGITNVDAVLHGLLFERFLAPERDGPPDIDLDIESGRREEVIQYVYAKYGRRHSAQVANVISYRPRSAVRDAAFALGHDVGQQDAWSKQIERWGSIRAQPEGEEPKHSMWGSDAVHGREDPDIPDEVVDVAEQMLGLPRHLGIHSGGMVLCDRPVIEVCPVEWARMPGRTVLQWDKDDCADAGLVKFDLLGLGMLSALRIAFENIQRIEGTSWTLASLPQEDPAVYDLLCAADTVGVFQVESRAQMATLPRLRPRRFYDIVVEVALIRPGPIQGGSVHPYIARASGREAVSYPHPRLEKSLRRTLGVPLFQEQLMAMAIDIADFTPVEADQLRRAMSSKRSAERMERLRQRFFEGMARHGIDHELGEEIFSKLKAFSDFGFPESHAYSFAYLVYASAWLKVYHPAAFYAALLAAQPLGFYSPQSLVSDARRHGVMTLRPDVQISGSVACVEELGEQDRAKAGEYSRASGDAYQGAVRDVNMIVPPSAQTGLGVRLGLAAVRHIGTEVAERLVAERESGGPFVDLVDLARRVGLDAKALESLATAGALECFGQTRRESLWAAGVAGEERADRLPGVNAGLQAPLLPNLSDMEQAISDVWATGITTDTFPTQFVRQELEQANVVKVAQINALAEGTRAKAAGVVTHRQRPGTAKGVTFLSLEDETGLLNVVCSNGVWQRHRSVARRAAALIVRGVVERGDGAVNFVAEYMEELPLKVSSRSRDFR